MTSQSVDLARLLADRYRVERELGRGGMATVYLAQDLKHDRKVAIKVLHPDLAAAVGSDRFLAEIRTTATLQHPNILPLFDSGTADGIVYYVMPFVEGESLRQRLERDRQFPVDEAIRLTQLIAGALDHAHRHGVIHRDIKPENILLSEGQPLVADFGVALAVTTAAGNRITQSGLSVGTPQYMSPEQATAEPDVDRRADIWALGAVLYEMLAGVPPYQGPSAAAITARKLTEAVPSLRTIRDTVPGALEAVVRRALARTPADRFATAHQFVEALDLVRTLTSGDAIPSSLLTPAAPVASARPPGRWQRLIPWAVAGLAMAAAAVTLLWPRPDPPALHPIRLALPTGMLPVALHSAAPVVAISPDGRTVAWVEGIDYEGQLFIRNLDAAVATPVKDAAHAQSPFFSPDGKWLAFAEFSAGGTSGVLKKLRLEDGAVFTITDIKGALHGGSWTSDGRIILGGEPGTGFSILSVSAEGGTPTVLARPDSGTSEAFLCYPFVLPDDLGILFLSVDGGGSPIAIETMAMDGGQRTRVMDGGGNAVVTPDGMLVFASGGALLAAPFDAQSRRLLGTPATVVPDVLMGLSSEPALGHFALSGDGTMVFLAGGALSFRGAKLRWVDSSGAVTPITELRYPAAMGGRGMVMAVGLRVAPTDGRIALYGGDAGTAEAFVYDPALGTMTRAFDSPGFYWPVWSSDGRSIIAPNSTDSLRSISLYRRRLDAPGDPERLTTAPPGRWQQPYSVSADGSLLFYNETGTTRPVTSDLFVLPEGGAPRPVLTTTDAEHHPAISPDGRWLAWTVIKPGPGPQGPGPQLYVADYPGLSKRWRVSTESGGAAVWSADGRSLFYVAGGDVWRTAFLPGADPPVSLPWRFAKGVASRSPYGRNFDVSRDGKRILSVGGSGLDTVAIKQLTVIVNFGQTLKAVGQR